jgi:hypothetical protein
MKVKFNKPVYDVVMCKLRSLEDGFRGVSIDNPTPLDIDEVVGAAKERLKRIIGLLESEAEMVDEPEGDIYYDF